jgi:hypothetical protein
MHLTVFQCLSLSLSYPMLEGFQYHKVPTQAQCRKPSDNTVHKLIYYFPHLLSHKGNIACKSPLFSLNISMAHLIPSTVKRAIIMNNQLSLWPQRMNCHMKIKCFDICSGSLHIGTTDGRSSRVLHSKVIYSFLIFCRN